MRNAIYVCRHRSTFKTNIMEDEWKEFKDNLSTFHQDIQDAVNEMDQLHGLYHGVSQRLSNVLQGGFDFDYNEQVLCKSIRYLDAELPKVQKKLEDAVKKHGGDGVLTIIFTDIVKHLYTQAQIYLTIERMRRDKRALDHIENPMSQFHPATALCLQDAIRLLELIGTRHYIQHAPQREVDYVYMWATSIVKPTILNGDVASYYRDDFKDRFKVADAILQHQYRPKYHMKCVA